MIRTFTILLLLIGCSHSAPNFPSCPHSIPVPVGVSRNPTMAELNALEIRIELARENERKRDDACAEAVKARDLWIKERQ